MRVEEINKLESKAIKYNLIPIFLMGLSGLVFGLLSGSNAVSLDGIFSIVILITVIIAKSVGKVANTPRNYDFPRGHYLLENIYLLFKIVILATILTISILDSSVNIYNYFVNNAEPHAITQFYVNIYYICKTITFVIALLIYTHFYNLTKGKSTILKVERKSVIIDGTITFAIAIGFLILGGIESLKDISDSIILLSISLFLIIGIFKDFKEEINKTIGKRYLQNREVYYLNYFNMYFSEFEILDVYIFYIGKLCTVSLVVSFKNKKSVSEMHLFEKEIKDIMFNEYDEIFLYLYWSKSFINYSQDHHNHRLLFKNQKI